MSQCYPSWRTKSQSFHHFCSENFSSDPILNQDPEVGVYSNFYEVRMILGGPNTSASVQNSDIFIMVWPDPYRKIETTTRSNPGTWIWWKNILKKIECSSWNCSSRMLKKDPETKKINFPTVVTDSSKHFPNLY